MSTEPAGFYVARDPFRTRAFRATFKGLPRTQDLLGVLRGELVAPTYRLERDSGGKPTDVIWTTYAFVFLLEERLVSAMRAAGLSGWGSYRVQIEGIASDLSYHGLVVRGRSGRSDGSPGRLCVEPSSWDGSDVFMPEDGSGWVLLSERAVRALRDARAQNIACIPIEEIDF